MKTFLNTAAAAIFSFALLASGIHAAKPNPSTLDFICDFTSPVSGNCMTGFVHFFGTGYPRNVDVTVTNISDPDHPWILDDSKFIAIGGELRFTESLIPEGVYEVVAGKDKGKGAVYASLTMVVDPNPDF